MSWFNRNKAPKPQIGDFRIEMVTTKGGKVHYEVQQYDWGWDSKFWRSVPYPASNKESQFKSFAAAREYVRVLDSRREEERKVVWP